MTVAGKTNESLSSKRLYRRKSRTMIPLLTPYTAQCFYRFFLGIEEAIGTRFSLGFNPDEEHLTSTLCEMLDERGSQLYGLPYSVSALNADLSRNQGLLRASISIETNKYNKHQERYLTQCDLGLIIKYVDYIRPHSTEVGLLIQAKRLYMNDDRNYSLRCLYEGFDSEQHNRLESIGGIYHNCEDNHISYYLFYNPPLSIFPENDQRTIIYNQTLLEHGNIFDYAEGLHRYEQLSNAGGNGIRINALFADVQHVHRVATVTINKNGQQKEEQRPFRLEGLLNRLDIRSSSFAWFIVYRLLVSRQYIGCSDRQFLSLVRGQRDGASADALMLPPRYVIEIEISVGTPPQDQVSPTQA